MARELCDVCAGTKMIPRSDGGADPCFYCGPDGRVGFDEPEPWKPEPQGGKGCMVLLLLLALAASALPHLI